MTQHLVVAPDGTEIVRNSNSRIYTHAILFNNGVWKAAFASSLASAEKELPNFRKFSDENAQIVDVVRREG
jgi:hypothetical protein